MSLVQTEKITRLEALLKAARTVAIVSHTHPDGDALGSTAAMFFYLKEVRGKDVKVVYPEPLSQSIKFISEGAESVPAVPQLGREDLLIALDLNGLERAGEIAEELQGLECPKVLIDHHLAPHTEEFTLWFSRQDVSSACELLYFILKEMEGGDPHRLPLRTATALMSGMTTDTNNFANSTFPSTLQMASELLECGVDRDSIVQKIFNSYRVNRMQAISYLLSQRLVLKGGLAYIVIYKEDLERFELEEGELEGLVNMPLTTAGIVMSITLKEDSDHFRVSIRSKKGTSANALARECFNGGGHEQAAGGKLFFPKDIKTKYDAGAYVEKSAARFVHN